MYWLSPTYTLREDIFFRKKLAVTFRTQFVSLFFYQHQHLNDQQNEQKRSGIGLGTDDK